MTPLVGRIDEIGMMRQRWERAVDGDGQVILLSAPAGMGKSRMTQAFRDGLGEARPICVQFFCSPYHTNSALYPFMRQLEFAAGLDRGDSADQKLDKLEAALAGPADIVAEAVPLLAALLSIPYAQRYPQLETIMSELVRKQRTMHVIEEQLALLSARGPAADRLRGCSLGGPHFNRALGTDPAPGRGSPGDGDRKFPARVHSALARAGTCHAADAQPAWPAAGQRADR